MKRSSRPPRRDVHFVLNKVNPGPGPAVVDEFVEGLGLSVQQEGLPRIAGRLLGFFIIFGGPFSFSALAERLRVSRGSVSSNLRILRQLGLIERVAVPGDRQDYYQLREVPYTRLLQGYIQRMQERLTLIETTRKALPAHWRQSRKRLSNLHKFYAAAVQATTGLIREQA